MIISDATSNKSNRKRILLSTLAIAGFALLYLFISSRITSPPTVIPGSFYCDTEVVVETEFLSSGILFGGGATQNGDYSRSGKYSSKIIKGQGYQYGLGFKLPGFKAGEMYKASVWRFREEGGGDGILAVSGDGPGHFNKKTSKLIKSVGGWELLEIEFKIPSYKKLDAVTVYVFTEGKHEVYFDDLLIQKTADAPVIATKEWTPQTLQIKLDNKAESKLAGIRSEAFRNGVLESNDDSWVKAKITDFDADKTIKANLRLKGDWLDHLKTKKWSFRIKTKEGDTFNRLRYFSIHTPVARNYLHEWVLHELFKQEDVLTTYYDFLKVELNDEQLGVYAIEEHFDKVLLERQKRREGPIIRFSEAGFWAAVKRQAKQFDGSDQGLDHAVIRPSGAPVTPFHEKKTAADPKLKEQFEQAQILMTQYKNGELSVSDIFDVQAIAKYFAICDALSAYHGITWHNQRFYFNPVTSKLEPIGYDGFAGKVFRKNYFLGYGALNKRKIDKENIENFLFLDVDFTKHYSRYLLEYTSHEFLNNFFAKIDEELKAREALLQTEFEGYRFDLDQLIVNARRMHSMIMPFDEHTLHAFTESETKDRKTLKLANFHGLPVEVIGSSRDSKVMTDTFDSPILLEAYIKQAVQDKRLRDSSAIRNGYPAIFHNYIHLEPVSYSEISVDKGMKYLFFKSIGIDSTFQSEIKTWDFNEKLTVQQSIFKDVKLASNEVYSISEGMVYFKKGKHKITESIIIPEGYRVHFEAGCQLDFIKKTKFISKSPIFINGNEMEPVLISSSDKTALGFTILQASQESRVNYAQFNQFNTLDQKGWTLTGAVTFYESDVFINNSVFKNNVCEDGLNIIRSEFTLKNSLISSTFGDGLDADFCKGTIERVRFIETGNDAMDFSGSIIMVKSAQIENPGDKGISVGEDTNAAIINVSIKGANIALASKDLSTLVINSVDLIDCNQGFTAFQKKPEYGGANIIVKDYTSKDVKRLHNIRDGCILKLRDKMIIGEALNY